MNPSQERNVAERGWKGPSADLVSSWRSWDLNDRAQPGMKLSRQMQVV